MTSLHESPDIQRKKKHRPASLDLNTTSNLSGNKQNLEKFALRLASPGLPPLTAKMQSTVLISKSIELQQKQLIAQRHSGTLPLHTPQEHDDIKMPESKKLKRDHIPKSLQINENDFRHNPLIKSAPIRPNGYYSQQPKAMVNTPYAAFAPQSHFVYNQPQMPYFSPGRVPPFRQYATPNTALPYKRFRPMKTPYATSHHTHRSDPKSKSISSVTDIFHGDYSKAAPLQAQPLSAQKEYFNANLDRLRDRLPVSQKEAEEMESIRKNGLEEEEKKKKIPIEPKIGKEKQEEDDDDVEQNAIDEDDQISYPEEEAETSEKNPEDYRPLMGQITIMNDNFKFEIFKTESYENDKEKFLRIAAIAWDKFAGSSKD